LKKGRAWGIPFVFSFAKNKKENPISKEAKEKYKTIKDRIKATKKYIYIKDQQDLNKEIKNLWFIKD
jgi:membrane protein insertase Oxa1/YidC/SpoIIIJ